MNGGKYVFAQIVQFLPKRYFERLVIKHKDRTAGMSPSYWSHMLVIMYGQLIGCHCLRELTDVTTAHAKRFLSSLIDYASAGCPVFLIDPDCLNCMSYSYLHYIKKVSTGIRQFIQILNNLQAN